MEEYYMDEKWRLSKEDASSSHSHSSSSKSSSLMRSISQKASSSGSSKPSSLQRSSTQKHPSSESSSSKSNFARKCKEQKAKFYIVKRCIKMLVKLGKSDDD